MDISHRKRCRAAQSAFLINHLLRELAHKAAADALINHGARPGGVRDMTVGAVAMAVMVVLMRVVMIMVMAVPM